MPPVPEDQLADTQRQAIERVVSGPRGELAGNWVPLLRSPALMTRLQLLGEYLRFESLLDDDLVELAVLVVARRWNNQFEWWFHHPIALEKGLPEQAVDDIGHDRRPSAGRREVLVLWDLLDELSRTGRVADSTYDAARALLGEPELVEAVGVMGYYTTLAMTMNLAQTPAPPGPRLPEVP